VAFGKLADFAGTLSKGAHVAVEGELRSHEYQREPAVGTPKTTLTEEDSDGDDQGGYDFGHEHTF
jgi:single-strand DNA-binding protein